MHSSNALPYRKNLSHLLHISPKPIPFLQSLVSISPLHLLFSLHFHHGRNTRSLTTASGNFVTTDSAFGDAVTVSVDSSTSSGRAVAVSRDSNSVKTRNQSKSRKKTNLNVEKKRAGQAVLMNVDGNSGDEVSNSKFLGVPVPDE